MFIQVALTSRGTVRWRRPGRYCSTWSRRRRRPVRRYSTVWRCSGSSPSVLSYRPGLSPDTRKGRKLYQYFNITFIECAQLKVQNSDAERLGKSSVEVDTRLRLQKGENGFPNIHRSKMHVKY